MPPAAVSALIITYNHGAYVEEALRSVLEQSSSPCELILVDDGSTDDTVARARKFGPAVRVLAEPHRGIEHLATTYNIALAAATGDLIALLEGDDRWMDQKIEVQARHFEDPRVVVSHGAYTVIGARGTILQPQVGLPELRSEHPYDALPAHLTGSFVLGATAMFRRSALLGIGGFRSLPPTPHWDYPTFLALAEIGLFTYTDTVVAFWRRHGKSGLMRLAGRDVEGSEYARSLALATRRRLVSHKGLPSERVISRSWANAFARQAWQVSRVLLKSRRFTEARVLAVRGFRRSTDISIRTRLVVVYVAALLRLDIERTLRLFNRRSPLEELS